MPWQDAPQLESRLNRALAAFDWQASDANAFEIARASVNHLVNSRVVVAVGQLSVLSSDGAGR